MVSFINRLTWIIAITAGMATWNFFGQYSSIFIWPIVAILVKSLLFSKQEIERVVTQMKVPSRAP